VFSALRIAPLALLLCACTQHLDVPSVTAPTQATHGMYFPIQADPHNIADCNVCHAGTASFRAVSCMNGTCHPSDEAMMQHQAVLGYEWYGASCYGCHKMGVAAGAPDHTTLFPIGPGQSHSWVSCAQCHRDPDVRANVTCAIEGCHGQAESAMQHVNVAMYTWTDAACVMCHPNGTNPPPM
jgi:hypothetical protein